ncbi:hypothetical protein TEA_003103 [Camellia sinensis var. sinensis]|uniref:Uncharacterized protein n=1 Tax=Camellia sinensis var. sinensis TaxID=542762 RepID=A0A4S4EV98_CAMSN|nr:hypothetical protein TEA_003103 [Camellia sinensis var. sinensis]
MAVYRLLLSWANAELSSKGVVAKRQNSTSFRSGETKNNKYTTRQPALYFNALSRWLDNLRCEIVNGVVEVEGVTSESTMDLEDDNSTKEERKTCPNNSTMFPSIITLLTPPIKHTTVNNQYG